MKCGKLSINSRLKPYPFLEVRWIKDRWRSRVLFGIACSLSSLSVCIRPFLFTVSLIKAMKPTPLSKEEQKEFEELQKAEQD